MTHQQFPFERFFYYVTMALSTRKRFFEIAYIGNDLVFFFDFVEKVL
jgi:hypothetical protein